jgi:hypothetical protein
MAGVKMADYKADSLRSGAGVFRLRAADILLVHAKRHLWSWIIRLGTHCYWNHALIVYSAGNGEQDFKDALIIDAKTSGKIITGHIGEYLNRPGKYDIAVKRLEADWFQADKRSDGPDFRRQICDVALNEAGIGINMRVREVADKIIRQLTVIIRFIRRRIRKRYKPLALPWNIRLVKVKAFTCSGFVQWCYFKGVSRNIARISDLSRLNEVIFNPRAADNPTLFELLMTNPSDLASSEKLAWKYVVKNGIIREVASSQEVRAIFQPVPGKS